MAATGVKTMLTKDYKHVYTGVFKSGALIRKLGRALPLPENRSQRDAFLSAYNRAVGYLDRQYKTVDGEYIAWDYTD